MELARETYVRTEEFPKSETFGLRMQMRRSAVSVASNIAEGHGRLTDPQLRNALGMARVVIRVANANELAASLKFIDAESAQRLLGLATEAAKPINGLLGVLSTQ